MHDRETEERTLQAQERQRIWECLAGAFVETVWDKDMSDTLEMRAQFAMSGEEEARTRCEARVTSKPMTRWEFVSLMTGYIEADESLHRGHTFHRRHNREEGGETAEEEPGGQSGVDLDALGQPLPQGHPLQGVLSPMSIDVAENNEREGACCSGTGGGSTVFGKRPPLSQILLQRLTRVYTVLQVPRGLDLLTKSTLYTVELITPTPPRARIYRPCDGRMCTTHAHISGLSGREGG